MNQKTLPSEVSLRDKLSVLKTQYFASINDLESHTFLQIQSKYILLNFSVLEYL